MHEKYLGDSYDIVKRFWAERLADVAPLRAHPRFIPKSLREAFHAATGVPVLANGPPPEPFGLFLDPDTGIPLPGAAATSVSMSHAPLDFIGAEMRRLSPRYLVCFDQSHKRQAGLDKRQQRAQKRAALAAMQIQSFYYVSHAPFLFAAIDSGVLDSLKTCLVASGIPASRFEP